MTPTPSTAEFLEAATEAARRAGRVLIERFKLHRTLRFKEGAELVTDADAASEAALLTSLLERFPEHAVLAEESGARAGDGYRWIVDPLDGTVNYAHGLPHFSVSVAVEGPDGLLAGVVYDPLRDELFAAGRGLGATCNAQPLRTSGVDRLEHAVLGTGFPASVRERPEGPLGLFGRMLRQAQGVRRWGSAALDLAYVAAGRLDGFFEFGLKPWDIAAGVLLVEEAGGHVSGLDGKRLQLQAGDVLAATPELAPALVAECLRLFEEDAPD